MNIAYTKLKKGFTLLEILLTIVIIGILATIVLVAINPNRQISQSRNLTRQAAINDIYNSLQQYKAVNRGILDINLSSNYKEICDTGSLTINDSLPSSNYCDGKIDLRVLVPTYLSEIPKDPKATVGSTLYEVNQDSSKLISIKASQAELSQNIVINPPLSIVNNGLVLHLDAGNAASYPGTGTTWFDLSGNNNNGTLVNGVGYNSANGGILVYDGLNDYVNIGNQNIIGSGTAPFSVEMWFYNTKNWSSGQYTMFSTLRQDTEFFVALYNGSGTLYVLSTFRGQTQWATPLTQSDYINKWICLSVVYNGGNKSSASSYITYSNGSQLPIGTVNFGPAGGSSNSNTIGIDAGSIFHQGNIGTYKVYNRALSAAEIQQNFNATKGRFGL